MSLYANPKAYDRHCVQHFVGQNHAAETGFRQRIEPADLNQVLLDLTGQCLLLLRTQRWADFHNKVLGRQAVTLSQLSKYRCSQNTTAGTKFKQRSAIQLGQYLCRLTGHATTVEGSHLRRSHKISLPTKLPSTRNVISQTRLVHNQIHIALKWQYTATTLDLGVYPFNDASTVCQRL